MQVHEWEKQEKLLDKIERQQIENCLQYNTFAYEKHEWDNIPGIVPRYIIYLSKYMSGICEVANELYSREHVDSLRTDLEKKVTDTNNTMDNLRKTDLEEKASIRSDMAATDKNLATLKGTYEHFTTEATKLDESACKTLFDQCMQVLLQSRGQKAGDGTVEQQKMRMYSFKQLFNIFTIVNNNSDMADRMKTAEDKIDQIFKITE